MEEIKLKGKFKKADIFSTTLHLVIYPEDGLVVTGKLHEIEEGEDVEIVVKRVLWKV